MAWPTTQSERRLEQFRLFLSYKHSTGQIMENKGRFLKSFIAYFVGLLIAFSVLMAVGIVPKILWALIGLGVISALAAALLAVVKPLGESPGKTETPGESRENTASQQEKTTLEGLENLVRLNLKSRESGLETDLLSSLELLVDRLFDILPRLNQLHRGSELAFVVNKIAGQYLNQITGAYLGLSAEARIGQKEELKRILTGLNDEVLEIIRIVDEQITGEFKTHAKFISTKFFGETVEA